MANEVKLEDIKGVLELNGMDSEDQAYVLTGLWTLDQIPTVLSWEDYDRYQQIEQAIIEKESGKGINVKSADFFKTPMGILANSYGARCIEWEEENPTRQE